MSGTNYLQLSGIANVREFGASGNGIDDDAGKIGSAIQQLSATGGLVEIPPGTYRLGSSPSFGSASNITLLVHPGTTFTGVGAMPSASGTNQYFTPGTAPSGLSNTLGAGGGTATFDSSGNFTVTNPAGPAASNGLGTTITTGAATGSGNHNGGDFVVNLGAAVGSGRGGHIGLGHAVDSQSLIYVTPTGTAQAAAYGLRLDPTWTDPPPGGSNIGFTSLTNVVLTGNNTATSVIDYYSQITTDASAFSHGEALYNFKALQTFNGTGGVGSTASSQTFQGVIQTAATCTGTFVELGSAHFNSNHLGTGTVTLSYGVVGRVLLGPSGGAADGNITEADSFYSEFYMQGLAATPGVVTTGNEYIAHGPSFLNGSVTSTVTTFYNFFASASFNTFNHTSTAGGFTAGAARFAVASQGGNTSGTNLNYGLRVTGAGGTSASGGVVFNSALETTVPNPVGVSGGNNKNYGLRILGNGGTGSGSIANFSISNESNAIHTNVGTQVMTGAVTDGYVGSWRSAPTYDQAFTVTRHNYFDLNNPALTNSAVLTDAAVFRFNAAAGTHKALNAATTKTTPTGVDAWVLINANGTLMFMPAYLSKTA